MNGTPKPCSVARVLLVLAIVAATAVAQAQTFSVLYNLGSKPGDPIDGGTAPNVLAQGRDGNLYTTSYWGGETNAGSVYRVTPSGKLKVLHSFDGTDGSNPWSGVTLATDGNFYGTTSTAGPSGNGTVFKITPGGTLTVLYSFAGGTDGGVPYAPPIQGIDGSLYGTARTGGGGYGTIYKLTLSGTFSVLHQFAGTDGSTPATNLIQATDGNFYGTTSEGGTDPCGCGTVFKMTPAGKFTVLYNFDNVHGNTPRYASLVQAGNGKFYGTTIYGGDNGLGVIYEVTSAGVLTVRRSFGGSNDGANLYVALVQATDGYLYGTAVAGGTGGNGTLFRIKPSGDTFRVRYNFETDDGTPTSPLLQNTNGLFYGKTEHGLTGSGTFYSFDEGLGPFITFLPRQSVGKVGASIGVLGQGFTGTTGVSFNGTPASFNVVSGTYLTATVPDGATTGFVTVTTPGGTLKSNLVFRVKPWILSFTPSSGPVGTIVTITGHSFTGATKVTFGGVKAIIFSVDTDKQITATVPTGAKTGKIGVTTAGGTGKSPTNFTVIP